MSGCRFVDEIMQVFSFDGRPPVAGNTILFAQAFFTEADWLSCWKRCPSGGYLSILCASLS